MVRVFYKYLLLRFITVVSILLTLSGCVTIHKTFDKGHPDFSITDEALKKDQIKKYSLVESKGLDSLEYRFQNDDKYYSVDAMDPLLREVSPKALETVRKAKTLNDIGLVSFVGALTSFGLCIAYAGNPGITGAAFPLGIGLGISEFFFLSWAGIEIGNAARQYNRDLREHFNE